MHRIADDHSFNYVCMYGPLFIYHIQNTFLLIDSVFNVNASIISTVNGVKVNWSEKFNYTLQINIWVKVTCIWYHKKI